jgi:hypothetical protein
MKFWDTIAKMCGVEYRVTQAHKVGEEVGGGYVCRVDIPWTARLKVGRMVAEITATDTASTAALNGHGVRVHDWSNDGQLSSDTGFRIGLIAIERIRPMVGKSGSTGDCAAAMTDFARKASRYGNAVDKPS